MEKQPVVLAISGVKNSGKTTLIQKLLPRLAEAGLRVAVVKHDGHGFQPEEAATDTGRYFAAGAYATAIFDGEKYQVIERKAVEEGDLIARFPTADLVLLEGFKYSDWPKMEVVRRGNSEESVCDPTTLLALVTDTNLHLPQVPTIHLDDVQGVMERILTYMKENI